MKKRWVIVAAIVAFSLLCAGLITYGVVTHTEAGLSPKMEEDGTLWDKSQFPLRVEATSYRADKVGGLAADDENAVDSAITLINNRLGFTAFRWNEQKEDPEIEVIVGVPYEKGFVDTGGHFELHSSGKVLTRCSVRTTNTGTLEILGLVLQHELYHCLGLAHDDFRSSIMYRVQRSTPDGQFPPRATDSDRKLLRKLYAP